MPSQAIRYSHLPVLPYVTAREAAAILDNTPTHATILRWAQAGAVPGAVRMGTMILIPISWLDTIKKVEPSARVRPVEAEFLS